FRSPEEDGAALVPGGADERGHQVGLADPGVPADERQGGGAARGPLQRAGQLRELGRPADQHRPFPPLIRPSIAPPHARPRRSAEGPGDRASSPARTWNGPRIRSGDPGPARDGARQPTRAGVLSVSRSATSSAAASGSGSGSGSGSTLR